MSTHPPHLAIVGCTGAVGQELLAILSQRKFPMQSLRLLASARSAGSRIEYDGACIEIQELTEASFTGVDIALFSAGGGISKIFAPHAVKAGAVVIDNSSAFRMDDDVPLVIPEINGDVLNDFPHPGAGVIANPNCSTITALMAVAPLHKAVAGGGGGIERIVV
ncbi:MAG: aspartate-semialdehyde dehydrogenase, partial [Planctomycetota bacterium]|nr:aspartate-semialdehyde dehydrogenase [Planctomycetota bacterium]